MTKETFIEIVTPAFGPEEAERFWEQHETYFSNEPDTPVARLALRQASERVALEVRHAREAAEFGGRG